MNREKLLDRIVNKKKRFWIEIGGFFLVLVFILSIFIYFIIIQFYPNFLHQSNYSPLIFNPNSKNQVCKDCTRRLIDGVYVMPGKENLYPIAAIIENHTDARPLSGLAGANLVFEAEAEGGITRNLAIYASGQDLEEIGTIRSARPYFVDWAHEFSAVLVHCGGSPEALVKINKENILSLNEFYNGQYYWRGKNRPGPHNIYTSSDLLYSYLDSEDLSEGKYLSWQFKDDQPIIEDETPNNITINFELPSYLVNWNYDRENNEYLRYLAGERQVDKNGDEVRAKNIAIAIVPAEVIDEELRLKMDHIGEGDALVCLDGRCNSGIWQKKSSSARTRFYKENGEEFKFNAGTTWIEVVRPKIKIEY